MSAARRVAEALQARGLPSPTHPLTDDQWAAYARGEYTQPLPALGAEGERFAHSGFTAGLFPPRTGVEDMYRPDEAELAAILARDPQP